MKYSERNIIFFYLLILLSTFSSELNVIAFHQEFDLQSQLTNSLLMPKEWHLKAACSCGKVEDVANAQKGLFPWTAYTVFKDDILNEPLCWGSVINNRYILSAAHCTSKYRSTDIDVILGAPKLNQNSTKRAIATIKNHPFYRKGNESYDYDVSLIKLREPIELETGNVSPICLPTSLREFNSRSLKINRCNYNLTETAIMYKLVHDTKTNESSTFPPTLKQIDLFISKSVECAELYPYRVKAQLLCGIVQGSARKSPVGSCQWESGAPLLQVRKMDPLCDVDFDVSAAGGIAKMKFVQIGISCGQGQCELLEWKGEKHAVVLFSRVSQFMTWIMDNVDDSMFCDDGKKSSTSSNTNSSV